MVFGNSSFDLAELVPGVSLHNVVRRQWLRFPGVDVQWRP